MSKLVLDFWRVILCSLFLASVAWGEFSGYTYEDEHCAVVFSSQPKKVFTDVPSIDFILRDTSGCTLMAYRRPPAQDVPSFWTKMQNVEAGVFQQTWLELDGVRALKKSRYEFSIRTGNSKLVDKVTVVTSNKVYELSAVKTSRGDNRERLEKQARAFWSTFQVREK